MVSSVLHENRLIQFDSYSEQCYVWRSPDGKQFERCRYTRPTSLVEACGNDAMIETIGAICSARPRAMSCISVGIDLNEG